MNMHRDALIHLDKTRVSEDDSTTILYEYFSYLREQQSKQWVIQIKIGNDRNFRRSYICSKIMAALAEHLSALQAQVFALRNEDMLIFLDVENAELISDAVARFHRCIADAATTKDVLDRNVMIKTLNMECDADQIAMLIKSTTGANIEHSTQDSSVLVHFSDYARSNNKEHTSATEDLPLMTEHLMRLESSLKQTDVSSFVFNHMICKWQEESLPKLRFAELTISIDELSKRFLPNINCYSNPHLFQSLTMILDRRILAMLVRPETRDRSTSISVNLNISTILSHAFLTFDEQLFSDRRNSMVIEFKAKDIFADLKIYHLARRFLLSRGYKICIDGLNHVTAAMIDGSRLCADWIKVDFSGELLDCKSGPSRALSAILARNGSDRVILSRVESAQVLQLGQRSGVQYFQGRHINRALSSYAQHI